MGEMGKDFCPNFLQSFLENTDRSCNDGGSSHLRVPWRGALLGHVEREEGKQVRINIQKTLEYLEGGNEVIPKSLPLRLVQCSVSLSFYQLSLRLNWRWLNTVPFKQLHCTACLSHDKALSWGNLFGVLCTSWTYFSLYIFIWQEGKERSEYSASSSTLTKTAFSQMTRTGWVITFVP